jgi:hypothetical protein
MPFNLNAPFQPTGDQPISAQLYTMGANNGNESAEHEKIVR